MANESNKKETREEKDVELNVSGKQSTVEGKTRTTGQGSNQDTRPGAEAEAPGNDGKLAGSPNQGTESR
ncbi:MAG: hypothetical protein WA947_03510 [Phormidesmis sp.]